jgi:hypothetical protein
MRKTISLFLAVLVTGSTFAADKSPISSIGISADNSSSAVAAAKERGAATASKDIKRGTLRILYYGKPWSIGKPLVDDATGYRIQVIAGCDITEPFVAEVEAYNNAVRAFHTKILTRKGVGHSF